MWRKMFLIEFKVCVFADNGNRVVVSYQIFIRVIFKFNHSITFIGLCKSMFPVQIYCQENICKRHTRYPTEKY